MAESEAEGIPVRVCDASTGAVRAVWASAEETGAELQRRLEAGGTPTQDQILLVGPPYVRLDPRRPLAHHELPSRERTVFIYDRRALGRATNSVPVPALEPRELGIPTEVPFDASSSTLSVDASSNPLLGAITGFEKRFRLSAAQGAAYAVGAERRLAAVRRCLEEAQMQCEALRAAQSNLCEHAENAAKAHSQLFAAVTAKHEANQALFEGVEDSLARLESVRLHPAIATDALVTLADCCPLDEERKWAARCAEVSLRLKAKVEEHHGEFDKVMEAVEREKDAPEPPSIDELRALVTDSESQSSQVASLSAELQAHLEDITRRVEEINEGMASSAGAGSVSMTMPDLSRPNEMWVRDLEIGPQLTEGEEMMRRVLEQAAELKAEVGAHLHARLRAVSGLQYKIQKLGQRLGAMREGFESVQHDVAHLASVRKLPESYQACLLEVVRRLEYSKAFEAKATQAAEELAHVRSEEVELRQAFLQDHLVNLPPALLQRVHGLNERPPQFSLEASPFDQGLPQITRASLSLDGAQPRAKEEPVAGSVLLLAASSDSEPEDDAADLRAENERLRAELEVARAAAAAAAAVAAEAVEAAQQEKGETGSGSEAESESEAESDPMLASLRTMLDAGSAIAAWTPDGLSFAVSNAPSMNGLLAEHGFRTHWAALQEQLRAFGFSSTEAGDRWTHPQFQRDAPSMSPSLVRAESDGASAVPEELRAQMQAVRAHAEAAAMSASAFSDEAGSSNAGGGEEFAALREQLRERDAQLAKAQADLLPYIRNAVGFEDELRSLTERSQRLELMLQALGEGLVAVGAELEEPRGPLPALEAPLALRRDADVAATDFAGAVETLRGRAESACALLCEARVELESKEQQLTALAALAHDKISCRDFESDDLALFLRATPAEAPAGREDQVMYPAFHIGCPHHYLSEESILSVFQRENRYPPFVVGRIVLIDRHVASEESNPFSHPVGTEYAVLTARCLGPSA